MKFFTSPFRQTKLDSPTSPLRRGLLLTLLFLPLLGAEAKDKESKEKDKNKPKKADESAAFFKSPAVATLKLELAPSEMESLRKEARTYVKCKLTENGSTIYTDVAIKLKGAAGSFQEIDQHPGFTLNMDRFTEDQSFHGLDKFHLNNSVQDPTYLNELLCSELFQKAGVPAPRITHARVWLNERDMGLYVVKEGFDKGFLKQHFENAKGNLYDGGFCQEVDSELELDDGKGVANRSDLKALADACRVEKLEERWPRMEAVLSIDSFITFMAMEMMTGHWDGYSMNRNNYRLYFDPGDQDRAKFLPHGMDQMFTDPGASVLNAPVALVAASVMQNPIWRQKYRQKLKELLPLFDPADALKQRVTDTAAKLKPVLEAMKGDALQRHQGEVSGLLERLTARAENLREQCNRPEPRPLEFDAKGKAPLEGWVDRGESGQGQLEKLEEKGKPNLLSIQSGEGDSTIASWRTTVLLSPGQYRFAGLVKTKDVKGLDDDRGTGAGLRISGEKRDNKKVGTGAWSELAYEFSIDQQREVELVAELRASKGQAWFDADSLRLVRVNKK